MCLAGRLTSCCHWSVSSEGETCEGSGPVWPLACLPAPYIRSPPTLSLVRISLVTGSTRDFVRITAPYCSRLQGNYTYQGSGQSSPAAQIPLPHPMSCRLTRHPVLPTSILACKKLRIVEDPRAAVFHSHPKPSLSCSPFLSIGKKVRVSYKTFIPKVQLPP